MTIVSTSISETTENLPSNGENLVVTSSGSIVNDNGDDGVDSGGAGNSITIDGLVYSNGFGVDLTGSTNLFVNGQVQGDTGVESFGASQVSISVGSQGSIDGVGGVGVALVGNHSATKNTLSNAGDISAGYSLATDTRALEVNYGGGDLIVNSGEISGDSAVSFFECVATENVENSRTIEGGSGSNAAAINSLGSTVGVDIVNSGLLTDGATNAIDSGIAVLLFDGADGSTSTIDNAGTISGSGYVIQSTSDILDISNSGMIHGGLYLKASKDAITNTKTGAIDGAITIPAGGDTITNAGAIDGAITFTGTGATNTLTNTGSITGAVKLAGGKETFANSGQIYGTVPLAADGSLVNDGTIHGLLIAGGSNVIDDSR